MPAHVQRVLESVADAETREGIVAGLERRDTFTDRRPNYIGFDEPTLDECIERLTSAVIAFRGRPEDEAVRAELSTAAALYLTARQNAASRSIPFGRASCLPVTR